MSSEPAGDPPGLRPPPGLDRDASGAWVSRGPAPRFTVAIDPAALAGRWIEIRISVVTDAETVRPSLLIERTEGGPAQPVGFTGSARGQGRWIGRLPPDLTGLGFEPIDGPGRFRIARFELQVLGRAGLVARAAATQPIETAKAVGWRLLGRRLRARYRIGDILRRPTAETYRDWLRENERISGAERGFLVELLTEWPAPPSLSVIMPVHNPRPRELKRAIRSVQRQIYPYWQLCVADDASTDPAVRRILERAAERDRRIRVAYRTQNGNISAASNTALELATGDFTALLDHDDELPPHALFYVAREIVEHPDADIIYTDEDKIDERGRRYDPHFKSDWNEELFLAQNYLNHLSVVRTAILRPIGGFRVGYEGSQDHDLLLRAIDETSEDRIRHIPRVLYHWRNYARSRAFSGKRLDQAISARQAALVDYVRRRGIDGEVLEGPFGFNRLKRRLPDPPPRVTAIVPTRDAAELTATCLRGLLHGTDYPAFDVLVLDNESREPETAALFAEVSADPRVRVRPSPGPFNFSALNNAAVRETETPLVLFLNNDIEVIGREWLAEMVALVMADGVGAVGARLLYPDDHVQHAGIILGVGGPKGVGGVAGHAQLGARAQDPGYFGRLAIPHYVSAVTAACMVVRREAFLQVGGFDAEKLAVAFNDVDLCLKLRAAGWKIAWTPYATLTHHESASRGLDSDPEKAERFGGEVRAMHERWGEALRRDPYYNPNFSLESGHFILKGMTPRRMPGIKPIFLPFRPKE